MDRERARVSSFPAEFNFHAGVIEALLRLAIQIANPSTRYRPCRRAIIGIDNLRRRSPFIRCTCTRNASAICDGNRWCAVTKTTATGRKIAAARAELRSLLAGDIDAPTFAALDETPAFNASLSRSV